MTQTALILGASGRFGRNMAASLSDAGWRVRRFRRDIDTLQDAAQGADVIVNGWNPSYVDWAAHLPGLTQRVIKAAQAANATVVLAGNVYVFGADAPARFATDTPHRATHPLGRLRAEMEATYKASGVPTIILRAGDFLDTAPSGNWFDRVIAAKVAKGVLRYPGDPDIPHAWAFLPDLARAAVALLEQRERLTPFADVSYPGYTLTGRDLAEAAATALGRPVRLRQMSWLPIRVARPFWPLATHLLEMQYLWNKPHYLDGVDFEALLPDFRPTALLDAMRASLQVQVDPDKLVPRPAGR